jgi:hypothetical protein
VLYNVYMNLRCFACDRKIGKRGAVDAITEDGAQTVYVGIECARKVRVSGPDGWLPPPRGGETGPRLYDIQYAGLLNHLNRHTDSASVWCDDCGSVWPREYPLIPSTCRGLPGYLPSANGERTRMW